MINPVTLGIIIDVIIVAIFALNMTLGYFKGFIKTVFGFLTLAASFFVAYVFAKPAAAFLKTTDLYGNIFENLRSILSGYFDNISEAQMQKMLTENTADGTSFFERFGRSFSDVSAEYTRLAAEKGADAMDGLVSYIIEPACEAIITAICFIVIFVLALIALKIAASVLDLAAKLPILRTCNRLLGLAAGGCIAFIQVIILTVLADAILPHLDTASVGITVSTVRNSGLYCWFSSLNPVGALFNQN